MICPNDMKKSHLTTHSHYHHPSIYVVWLAKSKSSYVVIGRNAFLLQMVCVVWRGGVWRGVMVCGMTREVWCVRCVFMGTFWWRGDMQCTQYYVGWCGVVRYAVRCGAVRCVRTPREMRLVLIDRCTLFASVRGGKHWIWKVKHSPGLYDHFTAMTHRVKCVLWAGRL